MNTHVDIHGILKIHVRMQWILGSGYGVREVYFYGPKR